MFAEKRIDYNQTNSFTRIVLDYLQDEPQLKHFYHLSPKKENIKKLISLKKSQSLNREVLVKVLEEQYQNVNASDLTLKNINSLLSSNCFTITTAHQPNLFTGPLYFIYKILHVIKITEELNNDYSDFHFVPVYYMGSEDADFAELNHTYVHGKKIEWRKQQKGAVGRMKVDDTLQQLILELEGQLSVDPHGNEVIALLKKAYSSGRTIQDATFELINELYGKYGLVVLIPDHPLLKSQMIPVFEEELFAGSSFEIVEQTSKQLAEHYDPQAHAREVNLFYLKDDIRERIEKRDQRFYVVHTDLSFSEEEIRQELASHPERFSPNVILRGLYQETILPNLAFVGGGGELAYWLQLKGVFAHYQVVFPMLVLRNSFLIIEKKWKTAIEKLGLETEEIFQSSEEIIRHIVQHHTQNRVSLNGNFERADELFESIQQQAGAVDPSLLKHVAAIRAKALKNLEELEKKMYRAEKRKFTAQQNQLQKIKETLFPGNGLQERVENFSGFYAIWGFAFIDALYHHSLTFEQQFTVLVER